MIKRKLTVIPLFLAVAGSVLTGCGAADIQNPAAETYVESKVNNTETQTGDASAETVITEDNIISASETTIYMTDDERSIGNPEDKANNGTGSDVIPDSITTEK